MFRWLRWNKPEITSIEFEPELIDDFELEFEQSFEEVEEEVEEQVKEEVKVKVEEEVEEEKVKEQVKVEEEVEEQVEEQIEEQKKVVKPEPLSFDDKMEKFLISIIEYIFGMSIQEFENK